MTLNLQNISINLAGSHVQSAFLAVKNCKNAKVCRKIAAAKNLIRRADYLSAHMINMRKV